MLRQQPLRTGRKENGSLPTAFRAAMRKYGSTTGGGGDGKARRAVVTMARPAEYEGSPACLPAVVLSRRCHGSLDAVTDSERRGLRPIGTTAREVAVRTGTLLAGLFAQPGVRIFQGVRTSAADLPCIPHVVSTGSALVLVESVAWPPGHYAATAAGRIHCDGVYIGQSVRPLLTAAQMWREALPRGHRVSAVVVVHLATSGELALPVPTRPDLGWTRASGAVHDIRAHLPREPQPVSISAVAALVAATADEGCREGDTAPGAGLE